MPNFDNSYSDSKGSDMGTVCRTALDELSLWIDMAVMQTEKHHVVSDSCLEKLATHAEILQKSLVRL